MGISLNNHLVVLVHYQGLADLSCRIIRSYWLGLNHLWDVCRLVCGEGLFFFLHLSLSLIMLYKLSQAHCILFLYCDNEGRTQLLSGCVGGTYWGLKLNVILCSWQSELASLCVRGRAASVGVDRLNHPTEWRLHLMQESCFFLLFRIAPSIVALLSIYSKFVQGFSLI